MALHIALTVISGDCSTINEHFSGGGKETARCCKKNIFSIHTEPPFRVNSCVFGFTQIPVWTRLGVWKLPVLGHDVDTLQVGDDVEIIGTVRIALRYVCDHKGLLWHLLYDCKWAGRAMAKSMKGYRLT